MHVLLDGCFTDMILKKKKFILLIYSISQNFFKTSNFRFYNFT